MAMATIGPKGESMPSTKKVMPATRAVVYSGTGSRPLYCTATNGDRQQRARTHKVKKQTTGVTFVSDVTVHSPCRRYGTKNQQRISAESSQSIQTVGVYYNIYARYAKPTPGRNSTRTEHRSYEKPHALAAFYFSSHYCRDGSTRDSLPWTAKSPTSSPSSAGSSIPPVSTSRARSSSGKYICE